VQRLALEESLLLFVTLVALYSPLAAMASYLPIVNRFTPPHQRLLSVRVFLNVLLIALVAIWVGEPLLEHVLGLSTDALVVTGGIALLFEGYHLMVGPEDKLGLDAQETVGAEKTWHSVSFMPLTFPLTIGGTTFGILVSFRAQVGTVTGALGLSIAVLAYALVTGLTLYVAGRVSKKVNRQTTVLLVRLAGILLTAIAVTLLVGGGTRMVHSVLEGLR
jgi:multiple antibiotic resistance protein